MDNQPGSQADRKREREREREREKEIDRQTETNMHSACIHTCKQLVGSGVDSWDRVDLLLVFG